MNPLHQTANTEHTTSSSQTATKMSINPARTTKVILTGATGFVGGELVKQLLKNSKIGCIVCLTRREVNLDHLTDLNKNKVKNLLLKDWISYSDDEIKLMADAEVCFWYAIYPLFLYLLC
jgi:nucleoside-diphosphate-sugar epimerase